MGKGARIPAAADAGLLIAAIETIVRLEELDPGQVARVASLLDEAMDLPKDRRGDWCAALIGREPKLSAIVAELLQRVAADADPRDPGDLIAKAIGRAAGAPPTLAGRRIGPYRVLRPLGQGGMGFVWLAENADGLLARKVALKLLHTTLVNAAMGERFMRERAILAGLEHPHIVRLLDAGIAEDGQPYLALEHVEGVALDTYCDMNRLGLDGRIDLMLQVLSAVQYAHQALVIHRDLKPANILVTAQGEVRLLDFGIAKLMTDGHAEETELTRLGGRALTPDYASPEQITGASMSTASDVYSLGVVLYGLLCGQRPYASKRGSRAALEEAILSAEPVPPSRQPPTDAIAAARATTSRKLAAALAGDLDTIVLKTLKKNPAERYPTAAALLQDLKRYREGEPVAARPDSASHRLCKFIGRHRPRLTLAAGIGLMLAAATSVSVWQADRARTQASLACTGRPALPARHLHGRLRSGGRPVAAP
jgi:serine/threonine-protein kinase